MNWKLCRRTWSEIISGKLLSGDIEGYSYTLDHKSKSLDRDLKLGHSG